MECEKKCMLIACYYLMLNDYCHTENFDLISFFSIFTSRMIIMYTMYHVHGGNDLREYVCFLVCQTCLLMHINCNFLIWLKFVWDLPRLFPFLLFIWTIFFFFHQPFNAVDEAYKWQNNNFVCECDVCYSAFNIEHDIQFNRTFSLFQQ